jgi:hypothetical protein
VSTHPEAGDIDPEVAADLLRGCHTRRLDREGIPMVIALVDERRATSPSPDERTRLEGATYAALLGRYADLLTPEPVFRHADEAALITALQVLAYAHFTSPGVAAPPAGTPEAGL